LGSEFFQWDHMSDSQSIYVDVIGIVEDIEDKTTYSPQNPSEVKSVIRVVVRNCFKSIRISFWTDQMKTLEGLNLKRNEPIIIEDVRKKQAKYYDYGSECNLLHLNDHPFLLAKYQTLLPELGQETDPTNIRELLDLYSADPNNSKLRNLK
jgi:hypothetical protein